MEISATFPTPSTVTCDYIQYVHPSKKRPRCVPARRGQGVYQHSIYSRGIKGSRERMTLYVFITAVVDSFLYASMPRILYFVILCHYFSAEPSPLPAVFLSLASPCFLLVDGGQFRCCRALFARVRVSASLWETSATRSTTRWSASSPESSASSTGDALTDKKRKKKNNREKEKRNVYLVCMHDKLYTRKEQEIMHGSKDERRKGARKELYIYI